MGRADVSRHASLSEIEKKFFGDVEVWKATPSDVVWRWLPVMHTDKEIEKSSRKLKKRSERLFLKNLAMPLLPFLLDGRYADKISSAFFWYLIICSHNLSCAESLIKIRNKFAILRQILFFEGSFFKREKSFDFLFF